MSELRCKHCGDGPLDDDDDLEGRVCNRCNEPVWSFRPRSVDHPQAIPEYVINDDGDPVEGAEFDSEQCDGCGCVGYKIVSNSGGRFAKCVGDEMDGQSREGCGQQYPITLRQVWEVVL